ncbi:MAG TPA: RNA polymerase sigma factor SigJ [Streptosporangiaceae bacterium]
MTAEAFGDLRPLLFAIAYRMLGSVSEAEDIVQEAFLRYHRVVTGQAGGERPPESPKAYLSAVTTRLCIDHARSARVRRETYVGEWLPEPLLTAGGGPGTAVAAGTSLTAGDPAELAERSDTLSMAFLLLLERLSPVERAVFLLHDVFGYGYDEIAPIVGRGSDACRQLAYRARQHVAEGQRRFEAPAAHGAELASQFFAAMAAGDVDGLVAMLATDAVLTGDSGGARPSWPRPIAGADRAGRVLAALGRELAEVGGSVRVTEVNGQPGALFLDASGALISVMALDQDGDQITAVHSVLSREKLRHLGPLADIPALLAQTSRPGRVAGRPGPR